MSAYLVPSTPLIDSIMESDITEDTEEIPTNPFDSGEDPKIVNNTCTCTL